MRAYCFRLAKLLRLREHLEEMQRLETLQQERVVHEATLFRDSLVSETNGTKEVLVPEPGKRWQASEQHEQYRYLVRLLQESHLAEKALIEKDQDLFRKRHLLLERSREKKTLERLESRKHKQWREEMDREEQTNLDDVGLLRTVRGGRRGSILLTSLLLLACTGMAVGCYLVWNNWLSRGDIGVDFLRAPFDRIAKKKVEQELSSYENQQRVKRQKREEELAERPVIETEGRAVGAEEGYRSTVQRILQREEALRKKEEALESQENSVMVAQEDLKREINRLNNLQKRISEELDQLRELEGRRRAEMSAERKAKLDELTKAVKAMTPKRAGELFFSVAFPSPEGVVPAPLPLGPDLEGLDLVVAVLNGMSSKDRGEILDAMTKFTPNGAERTAIIFDRLDNVRTGLEEDRFYESKAPQSKSSSAVP